MTVEVWVPVLLSAASAVCWPRPRPYALRGSTRRRAEGVALGRPRPEATSRTARHLASAGAGLAVAALVGGPIGLLGGVGVGLCAARLLGRLGTRAAQARQIRLLLDLPLAGDLLSAALGAGAAPGSAAGAVGRALGGPLGAELERVSRATELGAAPAAAWGRLLVDPASASLARPLVRAAERGSPSAATAARVSAELRRQARDRAAAAAEVVAVRGVGPLGLCFLPAFVLLGVVPLVAGSVLALLAL